MPHSAYYINGSNRAVFRYTDYFNLGFVLNPEIGSVLFIGGGGFSGPKQFLEYYPDVTVDVVEIDPGVVDTAWEYFGVPDDPRLRVYVGDGRAFLGRLGTYDLIVLDAYSKTYVPFHLMTREFFEALAEHLNPDGVVVSNLISSLLGDTSNLLMAEVKTVGEVFPQVYLFPTKDVSISWVQNIILVATDTPTRYGKDDLLAMAMDAPVRGETLAGYCGNLFDRDIDTKDSPLLTDDYAPTEILLNPVTNSPYKGG
jgi:spermidine synthase